ncbi:coadhesin-like [Mytilus edulis]|uniref:coadhesin-like n=1 Tax=Mytilus edulis TaxID=6550 RepID=UPI0039EF1586
MKTHLFRTTILLVFLAVEAEGCTELSGWTVWSSCTRSCATGTRTRSRKCCTGLWSWCSSITIEYSSSSCNTQCCAVHGSWSSYDPWNNCPVTCGGTSNNQHRSRYCNKPQPSCGGSTCSGTSKQYQICNSSPCPVDGQWSEWSSYGSCPVTCGSGAHSRYRICNNPSPANGGASCKGLDTEYTMCWSGECPVNGGLSEWSKFTACPVTCGGGTNTRTRACDNPTPAHGGNDCVGASSENRDCNTQACPDYCGSIPCENGASCENIHYGYKCTCIEGFQGNNCEIDIDDCISVDCLHGGNCIDKVNAYRCECNPGYAGHHCELGKKND